MISTDKEKKDSPADNRDRRSKKNEEQRQKSAGKVTAPDITNAGNISKDILDITETPDVATWNKTTQVRGNAADIVKKSQEREGVGVTQAKIIPTTAIGLKKKGHRDSMIDPANKKDVAEVVDSETMLTDKAEPFSTVSDNSQKTSKKRLRKKDPLK